MSKFKLIGLIFLFGFLSVAIVAVTFFIITLVAILTPVFIVFCILWFIWFITREYDDESKTDKKDS
jgi:amino acid transporter